MDVVPPPPPRANRVNRGLFWAAIIVTVIGWAPFACAAFAQWFAEANGCALDEGMTHACVVGGHDYGPLLYNLFVLGWLMLLTFPLMLASIVLWIVVLVQALRARRSA